MDWIVLLQTILEFIAECRQNRNREEVVASVHTLGPFERLALRLHLRRKGHTRDEIREAMSIVEGNIVDEADAKEIVAAAEEMAAKSGMALKGGAVASVLACFLCLFAASDATAQTPSFSETLAAPAVFGAFEQTTAAPEPVKETQESTAEAEEPRPEDSESSESVEPVPAAPTIQYRRVWKSRGIFGRRGYWAWEPYRSAAAYSRPTASSEQCVT